MCYAGNPMTRTTTVILTAALNLIMSAICPTIAQGQVKYHVIPIAPGSGEAVNDKGDVVGETAYIGNYPFSGGNHAFLYTSGGATKEATYTDLGVYNTALPVESAFPNAINNSGVIVGGISNFVYSDGTTVILDAFLYKNGHFSIIAKGSVDGGQSASAAAINDRGDIVGGLDVITFLYHLYGVEQAFLFRNGIVTPLGALGVTNSMESSLYGTFSFATSINNAGQIVGVSSNAATGGSNAFLWMNRKMNIIGSPSFYPNAINDNGWIAGKDSSGAVLYVYGLTIKLGGGEAVSLNNIGTVVGNTTTGAFLYMGKMYDLNTLVDGGWKITEVGQVNNFGQIAATGTMPGSTMTYALLLTPSSRLLK
jgi:probable HAF family extracellular repeat protein